MSGNEREILTAEQAKALLPEGETVHTFRSNPGMLVGCDWQREKILEAIDKASLLEIGGEQCRKMKHGLVVWTSPKEPLFVEAVLP